jgi:hypothetical protein
MDLSSGSANNFEIGRKNMSKKTWCSMLLTLVLTLGLSGLAIAQEVTGSIVGTVRDSSGAGVPGATVTVTNPSQGDKVVRTVTTTGDGTFSVPNVAIATYTITVEAPNFKRAVSTGVKVDVGQRREVPVTLEAGRIDETVTVTADTQSVELSTPTAATTITGDQVRELSINNRNFVQLVTLAPGVSSNLADQVYVGTTNPDGQANTVNVSVNGARSSQNTWTVDGADITDRGSNITIQAYPSIDSIGEFRVLRSLYPAESGRSGGGQINVVTRSGTDKFHGSLFEFVRNEKFNANTFFINANPNPPFGRDDNGKAKRAPFRYNNYGFTVGGPVYFLKFGERDPDDSWFGKVPKTYFFFSEEQRKDRRFPTLSSSVPTNAVKSGVFPVPICLSGTISGSTRTCTQFLPAGTAITSVPGITINPIAQAYLSQIYSQIPEPNAPNYVLNYPGSGIADFRQEIVKIDTSFTDKWTAYYRYQRDKIPTTDINALFSSGSGIPGVSTTQTDSPGRTHTFQTTYVFSPKFILEGRYAYAYGAILSHNTGLISTANTRIPAQLVYPNTTDRIPTLTGNGFNGFTGFGPYDNFSNKNEFAGSVTWIIGQHTMKYGAIFSKYRKNENALGGINNAQFSGFLNTTLASPTQGTVCADAAGNGITCPTANNQSNLQLFANFLLGNNLTYTQAKYDLTADFRQKNFEAYAQDEFRFRPNLTLYYGVRYSFFGSPWDKNGFLTNFAPDLYDRSRSPLVTGAGNRVAGSGNFCEGIIYNAQNVPTTLPAGCSPTASPWGKFVVDVSKTNFAPRVGLAWDPFKKGKTSIRTGYGIYHEQTLVGTFEQNLGTNPPYQETCAVNLVSFSQFLTPGAPCPVSASAAAATLRAVDPDYKTPYMQHWSLDWQQQVDDKTLVTIGYYGSRGVNLIGITDIDLLPPGYANSLGPTACATGSSTTPTTFCQQTNIPFTAAATILDQIRPYRGYRSINMIKPIFNSDYHSLQVSATRRFVRGSQVQLAYTWSKNLTDAQTDRSSSPQNPYDIRSEYGRAALDRRHVLTVNYTYELPWYSKQQGWTGKLLGGWEFSGITTYQTGLPFTITTSNWDPAGLGLLGPSASGARPQQIGDPNSGPNTFEQWFNTSAFDRTRPATFPMIPGSAGRGTVEGPSFFKTDITFSKNFRFSENLRLQLRAEAFNVFNQTNFSSFSTNVTAANFGFITAARDPRTMQFGVKFYF